MTTKANAAAPATVAPAAPVVQTLTLEKETKGTVRYSNETITGVYIPKALLGTARPASITITIPQA